MRVGRRPRTVICSRDFSVDTVLPEFNQNLYPGCLPRSKKENVLRMTDLLCEPLPKYNIRETVVGQSYDTR